jgi:exodeoxyribonuclease I
MAKSYLIYDIETSGLNKCFDQVIEFAAVRTDLNFNPIDRHQWTVQLNRDVVMHPQALLTHQLTPSYLNAEGQSESRVIEKIHQLLNEPGTLSGGYNTLGFDDEVLRFSFYRNFLPPYTHQYAGQCARIDVFPVVVYCYLYANQALKWPKIEGRVSLKLEHLAKENGFAKGQAHRAMADVEATLALARHLQTRASVAWSEVMACLDKRQDQQRFTHFIQTHRVKKELPVALLVHPKYGASQSFQMPALALGRHHHYKNQICWLRLDYCDFATMTEEQRQSTSLILRKKYAEMPMMVPFEAPFLQHLTAQRQDLVARNRSWLAQNPEAIESWAQQHREAMHEQVHHLDVDAALYQVGFKSMDEEALCHRFRMVPPNQKVGMLELFQDPGLQMQAARQIWRFHRSYLSEQYQASCQQYQQQVVGIDVAASPCVDYTGMPRYTATQAQKEIDELLQKKAYSKLQRGLLEDLRVSLQCQFEAEEV